MNSLCINQVLEVESPNGRRQIRVLQFDQRDLAIFDLADDRALPVWMSLVEMGDILTGGNAHIVHNDPYAPNYEADDLLTPASIRVRDLRLRVVLPLVWESDISGLSILRKQDRGHLIAQACASHGVAKDKVYQWLRLWWRHGQLDNALLPRFPNCGRGERQTRSAKVGRPLTKGKGHPDHVGVNVDAEMRQAIHRGVRRFLFRGSKDYKPTKRMAYQATLEAYFYKRLELKDGILTPIVRDGVEDDNRLPSYEQFLYHANLYLAEQANLKACFDRREYELKHRPVLDNSAHLSQGPGDLFLIDATVADVYLLSEFDKRWVIGRPILYLVIDHFSRMIVGLHVALEGPNWTGAMMALANAFTDKVEFCRRYDVEIEFQDWPCDVAPARLTADRGEVLSSHADYIVPGFRMTIHDTPPFRGDFKSFAEGQFKITNEKGLTQLPGWVDKLKTRGGRDYRYDATLTVNNFIKMMIQLALHNNHNRPILSNLPHGFPLSENGNPVPNELWEWGLANASPSVRRFAPSDVRSNLLPTFRASTTRRGLAVFGDKLHYSTEQAIAEGWFMRAPGRLGKHHQLAIDPWNVASAFIREPGKPLVPCALTPADHPRFEGKSLPDVLDYFARANARSAMDQRNRLQRDADLNAQIGQLTEQASMVRETELAKSGKSRPEIKSMKAARTFERDKMRKRDATAPANQSEAEAGDTANLDEIGPNSASGSETKYVPMPD